jgi:hypothetical protein
MNADRSESIQASDYLGLKKLCEELGIPLSEYWFPEVVQQRVGTRLEYGVLNAEE